MKHLHLLCWPWSSMYLRTFVFITLMTLCHLQLAGQMLINALPPSQSAQKTAKTAQSSSDSQLPDDPGQEAIPTANPEPPAETGVPVHWDADVQKWSGDTVTLSGGVVIYYRDYQIHADKIVYHRSSSELEAEGHLLVTGGPGDAYISASHGDMRLNMHTARFYDVHGSVLGEYDQAAISQNRAALDPVLALPFHLARSQIDAAEGAAFIDSI